MLETDCPLCVYLLTTLRCSFYSRVNSHGLVSDECGVVKAPTDHKFTLELHLMQSQFDGAPRNTDSRVNSHGLGIEHVDSEVVKSDNILWQMS